MEILFGDAEHVFARGVLNALPLALEEVVGIAVELGGQDAVNNAALVLEVENKGIEILFLSVREFFFGG